MNGGVGGVGEWEELQFVKSTGPFSRSSPSPCPRPRFAFRAAQGVLLRGI